MLDGRVKESKFPLLYHITPEEGLLNDPNGLVKYQEAYHVFYQLNPYGTTHQNKCWGHVVSTDMVHWKRLPIALEPSEYYDKDGIYSGSGIVKDDLLYLFYTGNVIISETERQSYQCVAVSKDGLTFEKLGPIIQHPAGYTRHVRDPKIWQEQDGSYWMLLGAQTEDLSGEALIYRSEDLLHWESYGAFLSDSHPLGYMWECPDLLKLGTKDCFLFSPQGVTSEPKRFMNTNQTGYLTGKFADGHFKKDEHPFEELDHGFEFYAPQTFCEDQRIILYGWMAAMPAANEQSMPTIKEGWIHCLTIPREVTMEDGKLLQNPASELESMRVLEEKGQFSPMNGEKLVLKQPYAEILIDFGSDTENFSLTIANAFSIKHHAEEKEFVIERTSWETGQLEQRFGSYEDQLNNIRIFIDGSSSEIFVNDGCLVFSSRYFVSGDLQREIELSGDFGTSEGIIYPLAIK